MSSHDPDGLDQARQAGAVESGGRALMVSDQFEGLAQQADPMIDGRHGDFVRVARRGGAGPVSVIEEIGQRNAQGLGALAEVGRRDLDPPAFGIRDVSDRSAGGPGQASAGEAAQKAENAQSVADAHRRGGRDGLGKKRGKRSGHDRQLRDGAAGHGIGPAKHGRSRSGGLERNDFKGQTVNGSPRHRRVPIRGRQRRSGRKRRSVCQSGCRSTGSGW